MGQMRFFIPSVSLTDSRPETSSQSPCSQTFAAPSAGASLSAGSTTVLTTAGGLMEREVPLEVSKLTKLWPTDSSEDNSLYYCIHLFAKTKKTFCKKKKKKKKKS